MKTFVKIGFSSLALFSFSLGTARAEINNQVSLRAGAGFPTSANDFKDSAKTGFIGGAQYLRHLSPRLALGGQLDYFSFPGKDHTVVLPNGRLNANGDSMATAAEFVARYSFRVDHAFSPYLIGGIGAVNFSQKTKATPKNGTTWADTGTREERTVADDSSTSFAASFGAGVEKALSDRMVVALEANWQVLGVDSDKFGSDAINFPAITAQLGYRF